ncbi:MAG: acetate--CoA ligase [Candidatus Nealsonbacteria bacterium]|nr:acetate--CoA ligase [Candidatus Nealsonbacteria bacterium]
MMKKGNLYYPAEEAKKKAWVKDKKIYSDALKDPVKFWEKLAKELFWFSPWKKGFEHKPPHFKWFLGGKTNITSNIFENNLAGWEKIKQKTALIWVPEPNNEKTRKVTYDALFKEVQKCANYLKKLGVKKGDRVGIYLPIIPEIVVAMLALARIGAVHCVVFSAFSPDALRIRLQDTGAKVLITADNYYRKGKIIDLEAQAREGVKQTKVKKVILIKRGRNNPWQKEKDFCPPRSMDSEDLQFILYTSGSTGKPKGCMHVCGGYLVQAYWTGKWIFDFHPQDIFWCTSDPGWITGHTYAIYSPLLNGIATLIYEGALDWPEPNKWAKIIDKHKVTIFYTAPTAIRMFKRYGGDVLSDNKFNYLRILGSVGEPIDESSWIWYFEKVGRKKCPILDTWWQTETGGILISSLPGLGPFRPAFTGLPFPGIKVGILDEKGLPALREGNLVILAPFAPGLLRGIYKDEERYMKTYWSQYPKGTYFTSDAALWGKDGLVRILGRVDDVIKVAGHRLATGELEEAVNSHPDITECAVIGIPDEIKGELPFVFAIYSGKRVKEEIEKEIIDLVRKKIGPIASPQKVFLVGDLPKTRSGKIMRRILKDIWLGKKLGDLSTLANPGSVNKLEDAIGNFKKSL